VGAILTGVFADKAISGADANLTLQVIGAFSTLLYSGIVTWVILWIVDIFVGLRVTPEDEYDGLDISQHAERVTS
ncbi:MAG TPA: ammonia channel protein, partial [Methylophilaceae bacterium]|nr:ammonia channel protein [Methylophilaceae bacterium]